MPKTRTVRTRRAIAAIAAAIGATLAGAQSAGAATPNHFSFSDCPRLPAHADPSQWRCEVMIATGQLSLGSLELPAIAPMTITHAEGKLNGVDAQVFGRLRGALTSVAGGLLQVTPRYAGQADFFQHGDIKGSVTLRFELRGPLLPRSCVVDPLRTELRQVGDTTVVSTQPPVLAFSMVDDALTVPAARHCGPLTGLLNRRAGLPGPGQLRLDTQYSYLGYDALPDRR